MERRDFFKKAIVTAGAAAVGASTAKAEVTTQPIVNQLITEKYHLLLFQKKDH